MKILNYDLWTSSTTISKQAAMKNTFVKNILDITIHDENIYKIYEFDSFFNLKNLQYISNIISTNGILMNIMQNIISYMPMKEIKKMATPVSMTLQDNCSAIYKQFYNYNDYKHINSLLLLHFPYPKVDKLISNYFKQHTYQKIENDEQYEQLLDKLRPQCSTIDIRKFIFLGCNLNAELLFNDAKSNKITCSDAFTVYRETKKIPYFLNILMNTCVWGMHCLFDRGQIIHILFFNPYNDILLLYYRRNASGCSKVDFFVSVPLEHAKTSQNKLSYINQAIQQHYL